MSKLFKNLIVSIAFYFVFNGLFSFANPVTDTVAQELLQDVIVHKPDVNSSYNYESIESKIIRVRIINDVKSEADVKEGDKLCFESLDNIYYKGQKLLAKGDIVYAYVESSISNGMNGIPGNIVLGNFETINIPNSQLSDDVEIYGLDLSWLVFPLKWALTFLPPTGSLTNFIKGGHANIKANEIIEIRFYPKR